MLVVITPSVPMKRNPRSRFVRYSSPRTSAPNSLPSSKRKTSACAPRWPRRRSKRRAHPSQSFCFLERLGRFKNSICDVAFARLLCNAKNGAETIFRPRASRCQPQKNASQKILHLSIFLRLVRRVSRGRKERPGGGYDKAAQNL